MAGRGGRTHRRPLLRAYAARYGFHAPDSAYARERGAAFAEKLRRGERV